MMVLMMNDEDPRFAQGEHASDRSSLNYSRRGLNLAVSVD
jgi:hypothetical protein